MQDDDIAFFYDDGVFYLDDETSEYLMHPTRSQMVACSIGVINSLYPLFIKLILFAVLRRIFVLLGNKGFLSKSLLEISLAVCGLMFLKLQDNILQYVAGFVLSLLSFRLLCFISFRNIGYFSLFYGLACLLFCQYIYSAERFTSTRGCFMVIVMKFVSACFELENGTADDISLLSFCAYLLDPSTLLFGPWISFSDFLDSLQIGSLKEVFADGLYGLLIIMVSSVFVLFSTCATELLYPDCWFLTAFGIAQSFRFSHYFISWLSHGTALISGCSCGLVSRWWRVEFPRSLVDVVVSWDLPMHRFLRKYVFAEIRHKGIICAVLVTYVVSSLLHGINFQLSAVLLSLGFHTFVETKLRNRLSYKFNSCIRASECKPGCKHYYKKNSLVTFLLNFLFRLLAIYHLVYLGMVFDDSNATTGYSMGHTLYMWSTWRYSSHLIAVVLYVISVLV